MKVGDWVKMKINNTFEGTVIGEEVGAKGIKIFTIKSNKGIVVSGPEKDFEKVK